jgi:hypothetical protein
MTLWFSPAPEGAKKVAPPWQYKSLIFLCKITEVVAATRRDLGTNLGAAPKPV